MVFELEPVLMHAWLQLNLCVCHACRPEYSIYMYIHNIHHFIKLRMVLLVIFKWGMIYTDHWMRHHLTLVSIMIHPRQSHICTGKLVIHALALEATKCVQRFHAIHTYNMHHLYFSRDIIMHTYICGFVEILTASFLFLAVQYIHIYVMHNLLTWCYCFHPLTSICSSTTCCISSARCMYADFMTIARSGL